MTSIEWWYVEENEKQGPVPEGVLKELLANGTLPDTTLIWHKGLQEWTPANEVFAKEHSLVPSDVSVNFDTPVNDTLVDDNTPVDTAPHPWRRLLARWIDLSLFTVLAAVAMSRIGFLLALLLWIPVEAMFLSSWGYTPGKWLTGMRVCNKHGRLLSFDRALNRSFLVWLKGLALGIPFFSWITMLVAYFKLKNSGKRCR
jgi:hypothetical protein